MRLRKRGNEVVVERLNDDMSLVRRMYTSEQYDAKTPGFFASYRVMFQHRLHAIGSAYARLLAS